MVVHRKGLLPLLSFCFFFVLLIADVVHLANVPMSTCRLARGTWYPIARNTTTKLPQGTCGYGAVASSMPLFFQNGYVTAPDDETYNGYPFETSPITITTGGVGKSCGECFELTGPKGRIVVMSADVCDKGCCDNCQGTTGNDVQNFDIDESVWGNISESGGGNVVVSYRKVSCDIANPLSFFFNSAVEGNPQAYYFRLRPFNQIVAVSLVEVKGTAAGGTQGEWVALLQGWEGFWNWTNRGDIGCPFQVRMTSLLGEVVVFPQTIQASDLSPTNIFSSGTQFTAPNAGYGGSSDTPCSWPGPSPVIYDDKQEGITVGGLIWVDWGKTGINFQSTSNPHSGDYCIQNGALGGYGIIQLGYSTPFPSNMFTGLSFWLRTSGEVPYSKLKIAWKYNGANPTNTSEWLSLGDLTSTWKYFEISMSNFTSLPVEINVLEFQNEQSTSSEVQFFLDDMYLLGGDEPYYSTTSGSGSTTTASSSGKATSESSHVRRRIDVIVIVLFVGLNYLLFF